MFNRDAYWFGILVGIAAPLFLFIVLYGGLKLYQVLFDTTFNIDIGNLQLISMGINLFFVRYYFVNKKYDESGRGVLLVTFIYVIAFFIINGLFF